MSFITTNFTAKLLSIKDQNITFSEDLYEKKIKNITYLVLNAKLSYISTVCPHCGNKRKITNY